MYDQTAQTRLQEKLDYELWLLDFLSKTQETIEGGVYISTITLRKKGALKRDIATTDVIGSGPVMEAMEAMSALTFVASYKILDMIFEWILEENYETGNIRGVPWEFSKKIKTISNYQLIFPPLFQSEPYIREYLFALYSNLLKFRHEIVHKNNFSVSGGILKIETTKNGQLYMLKLNRLELGALVRIVVAVANLLLGVLPFGLQVDHLLKYHLDIIKELHRLAEFGEMKPILENVELEVPEEKGLFPADLKFVREELSRICPDRTVLFNLKVLGIVNGKPTISWYFPVDSVPKDSLLDLRPDSYKDYRSSLPEEK